MRNEDSPPLSSLKAMVYIRGQIDYVSRSGGMSNELNNILSIHTDGVYEGVAIGGDRYPVSTFVGVHGILRQ